jgi:hypothetical protein
MTYIQYEPKKHKGLPLYEIQSKEIGEDIIATVAVKTETSHELAAQMPFYYLVKKSDVSHFSKMVVVKGSPKSGNWGHQGLPGIWGGSSSGGGKAKVAAKPSKGKAKKPPKKKSSSTRDIAVKKIESSKSIEVKTTPMLKSLVEKHGGRMSGLKYRLKTAESLSEKISKDVEEKGISEQEAANAINDAVRYTMIFDREKFVESVIAVQADLKTQGWTMYDEKYKNFFSPGDPYDGYNTVLVDTSGNRFELQFHTPGSIRIKHEVHPIYKRFGSLPATSPQRAELYDQMVGMWNDYERPNNWESLPGVRK